MDWYIVKGLLIMYSALVMFVFALLCYDNRNRMCIGVLLVIVAASAGWPVTAFVVTCGINKGKGAPVKTK